jgi:hypothetical protein
MDKPPINARFPLIVVKRVYYDQFEAGTKTVERRLHRPPFTARAFYPGRWVRLAYNYNVAKMPSLIAKVTSFDVTRACDLESAVYYALLQIYPQIVPDSELALITLAVMERAGDALATGVSTPR